MSTALAIASVTAVLKDLLNNGIIDHNLTASVGDVLVTALPPDRIDTSGANEKGQLNLFLYQVNQNAAWRNAALPSRDARGDRISNPPLALDLHYLLSAYGAKDLHWEILLGYGMQLLHETPFLARDAIRRALAPPFPVNGNGIPTGLQALSDSGLAEQFEQIKISPLSLTTEEISRLWTAFQAKYRPTAAYQVTVVLIESRASVKAALPVRSRNVYVAPFGAPVINQLLSQVNSGSPILSNQPILAGQKLVLDGINFASDDTVLNLSGVEVVPDQAEDTRIVVTLPDSLTAGVQGVQVVQKMLMGSPPVPHEGVSSNVMAFVLRPHITNAVISSPDVLTLDVEPPLGEFQQVTVLLNELHPPADRMARAYSFVAPPLPVLSPPTPVLTIDIPYSGVVAGSYIVRVQVDGAESPLDFDSGGVKGPIVDFA